MKPTKKRPAKRNIKNDNPILSKLIKLKYRINEAYANRGINTKKDKSWVMRLVQDIRNGIVLERSQLEYANELWRKYEG